MQCRGAWAPLARHGAGRSRLASLEGFMSTTHTPPVFALPPGAKRWDSANNVAIRTGKSVRTIESWCAKGLLHSASLAGSYGGLWVAVVEDGWPLNGPGVEAYRKQRSASARVGGVKGAAASAAARAARKARRTPRKSA